MLPRPPLSLALAGLDPSRAISARSLIEAAARAFAGAAAANASARNRNASARRPDLPRIQLDVTHPGLRPRELGRSDRRGLASLLRREGLALSGLDLWIPPEHFALNEHRHRAMEAARGAIELAAELAAMVEGDGGIVSLELPVDVPREVTDGLAEAAAACDVRCADHAPADMARTVGDSDIALGVGIDPASWLAVGGDPAAVVSRLGDSVASARLSDASRSGRVCPLIERGDLDLPGYIAALDIAGYTGPMVLDLRGVASAIGRAPRVIRAWSELRLGGV